MGLALASAVWLILQANDAGAAPIPLTNPAPIVVATPWPATLPCPRPRSFWFSETLGEVSWSTADGRATYALSGATLRDKKRLPAGFSAARPTRLAIPAVGAKLPGTVGGVECPAGAEIMWGPCTSGICQVSATYSGRRVTKTMRPTRHWTAEIPGSPYEDAAPDAHWTRFHRDVGEKKDGDPAAARTSIRFTRAFAVELRDLLADACPPRRCTALVADARKALTAYLRDPSPAHTDAAQRNVDNWNYVWSWKATAAGVALRLSCDDLYESRDLLCDLALDLPGDLTLVYESYDRKVFLFAANDGEHAHPLGRISGDAEGDSGPPVATIDGRLLALDEAGRPPS